MRDYCDDVSLRSVEKDCYEVRGGVLYCIVLYCDGCDTW